MHHLYSEYYTVAQRQPTTNPTKIDDILNTRSNQSSQACAKNSAAASISVYARSLYGKKSCTS